MLNDYGIVQKKLVMYCDSTRAINITKNPVQHIKTKHIDIRKHFLRELVEQGFVDLEYVTTQKQLADILTKSMDAVRFEEFWQTLKICVLE